MRIIYPKHPLNSQEADEPYHEEFSILKSSGVDCSLFDFDTLDFDEFRPRPGIEDGESVLYRGWMLNPERYKKLVGFILRKGATPVTSAEDYLACHHLPGWYEQCIEFTAESRFFPHDANLRSCIETLGWDDYFVKDFVKSNSTERGSIASSAAEVLEIIELIEQYRGEVEGGIALRRVEQYIDSTETRHFVFNGKAYSPDGNVPGIVLDIARRVDAPFYSVDIIQREDGQHRLVEVGDGQVSDKKSWPIAAFAKMLIDNA
ncbi:hypothetical protein BVY04_04625 [bacterium M21]|nr:hypothetical protein BVY04_04625 [bacterium M21]